MGIFPYLCRETLLCCRHVAVRYTQRSKEKAHMDVITTVIAWSILVSMIVGVIGGWLVFVIAWLNDLHTSGTLRWPVLQRRTIRKHWSLGRRWAA